MSSATPSSIPSAPTSTPIITLRPLCGCAEPRTVKDLCVVVVTLLMLMMLVSASLVECRRQKGEVKEKSAKDCLWGTHNCHKQYADCITSRRSYKCKCKDGFYGDGKVCVDDDECEFENGGCVHRCENSPGNFSCSCYHGFSLAQDGLNCVDTNECERNAGGCSQHCVNTVGSFQCRCRGGYFLHSDGRTCIGEQSSQAWCGAMLGCGHHCDTKVSGKCACRHGHVLAQDGKACIQTCSLGNGGCHHRCTDSPSGPVCSCAPKYILTADKTSCIPSCGVRNGGCEKKCRNTPSGPVCSCPAGYRLQHDGASCLDIDECLEGKGGCSHRCINTHGSYECVCPTGHRVGSDKKTCQDIDECATKDTYDHYCDHMCHNTPGSYQCSCRPGYQTYGITHCADIDECSIQNGGCQHSCTNTEGRYRCSCQPGFKLHPNGRDCIQAELCLPIQAPPYSLLSCQKNSALSQGEQLCSLRCYNNARFISLPNVQVTLSCGPSTQYEWLVDGGNVSLPTCSVKQAPLSYKRRVRLVYIMRKSCDFSNSSVESLRSFVSNIIRGQKRYKCKRKCQVNRVTLTCGSRLKKLKRLVRSRREELVTMEMEIQMNSKMQTKSCDMSCMSERTSKQFKRSIKKLKKAIRQKKFLIKYEGREYWAIKKSFKMDKNAVEACGPGYVLVNNMCVACSLGTFYDTKTGTCRPCEAGSYQNREGKLRCKTCGDDVITGPPGAVSRKQCTELCAPGLFSPNGSMPCQGCPGGMFQPQAGRTSCVSCGRGMPTSQPNASSFVHCRAREVCKAGHHYDVIRGSCQPCPVGTYQQSSGQNYCVQCPGQTTTDQQASTSPDQCKDPDCGEYMGQFYGIIRSPNYPGHYPNNVNCVWTIKPEKRRRILIIIPDIHLSDGDDCGDVLVMRKSKSPYSRTTYETCVSRNTPIAFTARSKKLWIQFKSDGNNTAGGFSIPFVAYNEEYHSLIENIVKDGRLYSSYQHQQIFKNRQLLHALLEVIATPYNYLKYANVSRTMFPDSFFRFLTPKVRDFFYD